MIADLLAGAEREFGTRPVRVHLWAKPLEDENARLKRLVAEQALDNQMLRDLLRKNP